MRPASTDMMQGFRYHVKAEYSSGENPLQRHRGEGAIPARSNEGIEAGFQSVTIPELSVEIAEYREGTFKWTQKYPGVPTISDVTLMRGVTKKDSSFYKMVMASIEGKEYRADVHIYHYQRAEMEDAAAGEPGEETREILCHECFASRAKPQGDLDSMTGDVSLAEVDIAIESFEIMYGAETA